MSNNDNDSTTAFLMGAAVGGVVCVGLTLLLTSSSGSDSCDQYDDRDFASSLGKKSRGFADDVRHVASDFQEGNYGSTVKEVLELASKGFSLWQNLSGRR